MDWIWKLRSTLEKCVLSSGATLDLAIPPSARPERLNDQVFEVCKPAESERPSLEIVFFHGLQLECSSQPHLTSWLSRDKSKSELWLHWLQDKDPDIRVLVVSYDASSKRREEQGVDMFITCENLLVNLTDSAAHVGEDGCPVILVGHSLGGLVMKEVCMEAHRKLSCIALDQRDNPRVRGVQNFIDNMIGVFFYATPHHGAIILPGLSDNEKEEFPLNELAPLNKQVQRRNEDFRKLREFKKWRAAGVGEGLKVSTDNFTGFVVSVPEASSRSETDTLGYYTITTADHFSICRPTDKECASFTQLWNFIEQCSEYQCSLAPPLSLPHDIVGMDGAIKEVEESLKSTDRLAIIGMGGIGKTTLVRNLYDHIKRRFQYACLVEDVKGKIKDLKDISCLRKWITDGLTVKGMRPVEPRFDWAKLKNKKVLIILDDVEKRWHVKMTRVKDEFSRESRVIVTSRNKTSLGSEGFKFYEMEFLADPDAYKLLCSRAFRKEEAPDGFQSHAKEVVKRCGRLPLALEAVGSSLYDRELKHWTEMIETIAGAHSVDGSNEDELWPILRKSIDTLGDREREMFLDIATCFHGERLWEVKRAWKFMIRRSAESGWQNLVDRCLAKEMPPNNPYAVISMHELLRDLGKSIACPIQAGNSLKHTRVDYIPIANKLSSEDRSRVQILRAYGRRNYLPELLDMRILHDFHDLQALWLNHDFTCHNPPEHLIGNCIFPAQLTFVYLQHSRRVAMNGICQIKGLRCLILHGGVVELPPSLGDLVHLEYLSIDHCEFSVIPGEIDRLQSLYHLEVTFCRNLKIVPTEIGKLENLHHLCFEYCRDLQTLPSSIAQLRALKTFKVIGSESLQVPFSLFCRLHELEIPEMVVTFRVDGCYDLRVTDNGRQWVFVVTSARPCQINEKERILTKGISGVGIHVHLWDCGEETCFYVGGFENVPEALSDRQQVKMECLVIYDVLGDIERLSTLSTDDFRKLRSLEIIHCSQVGRLPPFGPQLSALRLLRIHDVPELETLPELWPLQGLQVLELSDLPLERLPESIGHLRMLESLRLRCLHSLSGLPESIGHLQALIVMELIDIPRLQRLPEAVGKLMALQALKIDHCTELKLPWGTARNWSLRSLETLTLDCDHVGNIDRDFDSDDGHIDSDVYVGDGSQLPDTSTLDIYHPNVHCWEWFLDCFRFSNRPSTVQFPEVCRPQRRSRIIAIEVLEATIRGQFPELKCVALTLPMHDVKPFLDLLQRLSALERLEIIEGWTELPEALGQLKSLKILKVGTKSRWMLIMEPDVELPESMGQLSALEQLVIRGCTMPTLPAFSAELGSLKLLKIERSHGLLELPEWVGRLHALEQIEISLTGCKQLTKLKGPLGQVRTLERLIISGCTNEPLVHWRLAGILHSIVVVERGSLRRLTITDFDCKDEELSASFGQLPCCEQFDLVRFGHIKSLPQSVGQIGGLKCLTIESCRELEELPEFVGQLGLLERVAIKSCPKIVNLVKFLLQLRFLEELEIDQAILVKLAGHLGQFTSLKRLIVECSRHDRGELPDSLGQLGALEELFIRNQNKSPKYLEKGVWTVHPFESPENVWRCYEESAIRELPKSIGQLSVLTHLEISDCEEITQLPATVGKLSLLERIVVRRCPKLEAWRPSSQHLQHVQELELTYEHPERHVPMFKYENEVSDELVTRNEVYTMILQPRDLRETAEEGRSLLEAAECLRDRRIIEEARLG